ncbi:hypothetical protein SAMN06264364_13828 [Quadrisphaera granulorum]|uniref:Uncharacterized protein n=1 Tax=Quadrisphaera granulorum TaxID=317664 RepID=A0A315ZQV7_9ACTN|nr:hypothetical protein [Quadrisphaera granulorum]PWJ47380.1 hypothetical protein BXY45_13828 [Quadrisphaera granulorum]SZE98827.1 hypothetical protein SAMN06264364_13828 [Quadrisphaera granulorum]
MSVPPPRHEPREPQDAGESPAPLVPADPRALDDLAVLVSRASRADSGGAARLVAGGGVLAVWVSPLHGAGLPTVLGLRTLALAPAAEPRELDVVVELAALADRLARRSGPGGGPLTELAVPPVDVGAGTAWAGLLPPRSGWAPTPPQEVAALRQQAAADPRDLAAALARAADALGFLPPDDHPEAGAPVTAATAGAWRRLSTRRGHVLGRHPLLA